MRPLADWLDQQQKSHPSAIDLDLTRVRSVAQRMGLLPPRYHVVTVAGTNGKGSTVAYLDALFRGAGKHTGRFTSPHLVRYNERICIDGVEAADGDLIASFERIDAARASTTLTFFEYNALAALDLFARKPVDVAVLEVGLGGRLDATNVLDAEVVLLTNVSLEHTEVLGDTEEQIAREKLAVAHAARTVVLPDDGFRALVPAGAEVRLGGAREAAAAFLGDEPPSIAAPMLAGRLERRGDEVRDGAHNPAGARWLADRLEPEGPYVVVASILRDKDADAMLAQLARLGDTLVATASENPRALAAGELAEAARRHFRTVEAAPDPAAALARARALDRRVLVTGSLYLLADLAREESAVP